MPRYLAVYINAGHDRNGNPRRGWYVHDTSDYRAPVRFVDEGYHGNARLLALVTPPGCVPGHDEAARPIIYETGRIDVTPGEYRAALKLGREK